MRLLIILLVVFGFAVEATAWTYSPPAHPRLGIVNSGESIATLKSRCGITDDSTAQYESHAAEYTQIADVANDYDVSYYADGANKAMVGMAHAFVYLMEGNATNLTQAKALLDWVNTADYSEDKEYYGVAYASLVFDWIWQDLDAGERTTYAGYIESYVTGSSYYSTYATFNPYYNQKKYIWSLFAWVGQAIYDEEETTATTIINRLIDNVAPRMQLASDFVAPDGMRWPLGRAGYSDESGWVPLISVLFGAKATGLTLESGDWGYDSSDYASIAGQPYGEIYDQIKDNYAVFANDVDPYNDGPWHQSRMSYGKFISAYFATFYEGEEAGKITNYIQSKYTDTLASRTFAYLGSVLWNDKTANAIGTTITDLDNNKLFGDSQFVYRSAWNLSSDQDDIFFQLYAQEHVNGHTHYNKGGITIWRGYDYLTFHAGGYPNATTDEHFMYYGHSIASNNLLVWNTSEDEGVKPDEGGQLTNSGEGDDANGGVHGSTPWASTTEHSDGGDYDITDIDRFTSDTNHFYTHTAFNDHSYSPTKMDGYTRSIVRLGDFFIVYDRWDGDTATSYFKRQVWQAPTAISGGSWSGSAPDEYDTSNRTFYWDQGDSRLYVQRVFPEPSATDVTFRTGGGSVTATVGAYQYYASVEENNHYESDLSGDYHYGLWRLEFSDGNSSYATTEEDGHFLTVLSPMAISGAAAPTIHALGSASSGDFIGVEIVPASGDTQVVIFSNDVTETTDNSKSFSLTSDSGDADILVADLTAGTYAITGESNQIVDNSTVYYTADLSVENAFDISAINTTSTASMTGASRQ